MRDQLAVEAFVDSLNESELEIRVKDRFPKNLAEAFQVAIMLEANQIRSHKETETKREKAKVYRPEIEARRVNWSDNDPNQYELLLQEFGTYKEKMERFEEERKNDQLKELQHRVQTMEVQIQNQPTNRIPITSTNGRTNQQSGWKNYRTPTTDNARVEFPNERNHQQNGWNNYRTPTPDNIQMKFREEIPRMGPQIQENQQRACPICQSVDHSIHHCPHAICGGCRNYGHTRKVCPNNNFNIQYPARIFRIRYQNRSSENNNEFRRTVENMREFQVENSNEILVGQELHR